MFKKTGGLVFLCAVILTGCSTITVPSRDSARAGFPEGTVVFTFDDGPNAHEDTTLRLLDVLEAYDIRACFFLLGINAEHNPALVRRIAAGGHLVYNHGYGEAWAVFLNGEAFTANLLEGESAIAAVLEQAASPETVPASAPPVTSSLQAMRVYRPHGGFFTKKQRRLWEDAGYRMGPCTIRIHDAVLSAGSRDKAIARVIAQIEKQRGGIILLHDSRDAYTAMEVQLARNPHGDFDRSWIPAVVEEIILFLKDKGYRTSGFNPAEVPGFLQ